MNKLEEFVKSTTGETRQVLDKLVHSLADSVKTIKHLEQQIEYIKHDNKLLKRKLFGSSSEKITSNNIYSQNDLFNEFELCAEMIELEEAPVTPNKKPSVKKRPGRKPLPTHFPRQIVEHD